MENISPNEALNLIIGACESASDEKICYEETLMRIRRYATEGLKQRQQSPSLTPGAPNATGTIKFNPDLESEGGKLYRRYCEEKGIDFSVTAGANFCLGYMAVKEAQAGPVWVKASSIAILQYTTYYAHWRDDQYDIKGSGFFNSENEFLWDNSNLDEITKEKSGDLLILDESAAGREDDAVEAFAEWIAKERFESTNGKTLRSSNWNCGMPYSPAQVYELFKQQKEK